MFLATTIDTLMWKFQDIRGPNIDPKWQGSYCKDIHKRSHNLQKQPYQVPSSTPTTMVAEVVRPLVEVPWGCR